MLVPESLYREKMKIDTCDVLKSIKQPYQCKMLKGYSLAQNVLQGPNIDMDRYQEAMQDFSVLKDRVIGRQITDPPVVKKQCKVESKVDDDEGDIDKSVINTLPENQQVSAKKIMRLLRTHGGDLVSWTSDEDVKFMVKPYEK